MKKKNRKRSLKKMKYISFIFLIIVFVELCYIGYSLIAKREISLYFDGINAIDSSSSYYVTVGSNNDNALKFEKAKVSMYDKNREKTFEKLYNVGYNSAFFGVSLDGEDIVAVGSYEKNSNEHANSIRRALIVKYNKEGNILFHKDFKLLDNSRFTSIVVAADGYYVTGQSVYQSTKVGQEAGGAILAKYSKDGKLLWSKNYGNSKSAVFNDLLVVNHSIYVVGMDENYLGIICRYDLDGNFISYNHYQATDDIGFSGIIQVGNSLYVSGAKRSDDETTNAMIVQYDLNCQYVRNVIYENEGMIRYNKLMVDHDDHIIAIGVLATSKVDKNKTADILNYDGIIGKYTYNLEEVAVVTYGEERDDYFTDIVLVNNEYLVVGYSSYEDGSYLSKFIRYSSALKVLEVH